MFRNWGPRESGWLERWLDTCSQHRKMVSIFLHPATFLILNYCFLNGVCYPWSHTFWVVTRLQTARSGTKHIKKSPAEIAGLDVDGILGFWLKIPFKKLNMSFALRGNDQMKGNTSKITDQSNPEWGPTQAPLGGPSVFPLPDAQNARRLVGSVNRAIIRAVLR